MTVGFQIVNPKLNTEKDYKILTLKKFRIKKQQIYLL